MLEKLRQTEEKYAHLEASLSAPDVISNPARYVEVMKEYRTLTPIMEAYRAYCASVRQAEEAFSMMESEDDAEVLKGKTLEEIERYFTRR